MIIIIFLALLIFAPELLLLYLLALYVCRWIEVLRDDDR